MINFVGRLLKMSNFTNHMRNLWIKISLFRLNSKNFFRHFLTIRIFEKFNKASGVKSGVPSSINDKSVRYIPRYGMQGGSHRWSASRITRNLPSEQTTACNFVIVDLICKIIYVKNLMPLKAIKNGIILHFWALCPTSFSFEI